VKHISRNHRGGRKPVNSVRPEQAEDLFGVLNSVQDSLKSKEQAKKQEQEQGQEIIIIIIIAINSSSNNDDNNKLQRQEKDL